MSARARASVVAAAAVAAASCGVVADVLGGGTAVRDSAGVRIVEHGGLDGLPPLLALADPLVEIGVLEGEKPYLFSQITAAARLSDGRIAVTDAGSRELRIFGPDGVHRTTAGGAGEGPMEFRFPSAIVVGEGDTLVVQDVFDRVVYAPDGSFVERRTTDHDRLRALWTDGVNEGLAWLPDGSALAPVYARTTAPPRPGPYQRPPLTMIRVADDLGAADTLGAYGGIGQQFVDVGAGGVRPIVPPFAARTHWASGGADGTVVLADDAVPELHLFGPGRDRTIVRWRARPGRIDGVSVEAWKEVTREAPWAQRQLEWLERAWLEMELPPHKPFHGGVAVGRDGAIWMARTAEPAPDSVSFVVFEPDGMPRGEVKVPAPFRVLDSGPEWVLGVHADAVDVERVRLYALSAPPG